MSSLQQPVFCDERDRFTTYVFEMDVESVEAGGHVYDLRGSGKLTYTQEVNAEWRNVGAKCRFDMPPLSDVIMHAMIGHDRIVFNGQRGGKPCRLTLFQPVMAQMDGQGVLTGATTNCSVEQRVFYLELDV